MASVYNNKKPKKQTYDIVKVMAKEGFCVPTYLDEDLRVLKNRSKVLSWEEHAYDNIPLYKRMIECAITYIMGGEGVELVIESDVDDVTKNKIKEAWKYLCENIDLRDKESMSGIERDFARHILRQGECVAVFNKTPEGTKLSFITSKQIKKVNVDPKTGKWISIEYSTSKNSSFIVTPKDALYVSLTDSFNATRGIGFCWSAFKILYYIDMLLYATVKGASEGAKMVSVITSELNNDIDEEFDSEEEAYGVRETDVGVMMRLLPGEDAKIFKQENPNPNFEAAIRPFLKLCCSTVGFPVDLLLPDWGNTTYSSNKALTQHLKMYLSGIQDMFTRNFYHPVVKTIFTNDLEDIDSSIFDSINFVLPEIPSIDLAKEADADLKILKTGTASMSSLLKSRNEDYDETLNERVADIKKVLTLARETKASIETEVSEKTLAVLIGGEMYKVLLEDNTIVE